MLALFTETWLCYEFAKDLSNYEEELRLIRVTMYSYATNNAHEVQNNSKLKELKILNFPTFAHSFFLTSIGLSYETS